MRVAMITCTPKPTVGRLVPVSRCPIYSRRHASLAWLDVGLRPTPNARASDQSRAASDRFLAPTAITSVRPRATIPAWLLRIISSSDAKDDCRFDFGRLSNFILVSPMILVLVDRNDRLGDESAHRPQLVQAPPDCWRKTRIARVGGPLVGAVFSSPRKPGGACPKLIVTIHIVQCRRSILRANRRSSYFADGGCRWNLLDARCGDVSSFGRVATAGWSTIANSKGRLR